MEISVEVCFSEENPTEKGSDKTVTTVSDVVMDVQEEEGGDVPTPEAAEKQPSATEEINSSPSPESVAMETDEGCPAEVNPSEPATVEESSSRYLKMHENESVWRCMAL